MFAIITQAYGSAAPYGLQMPHEALRGNQRHDLGGRTTCALQGASAAPPFRIPDRSRDQRRSRKMESRQRRFTPDLMTLRLSILRPVLVGAPPWHRGRAQPNYQHGDGEDLPTGRGACTPLVVRGRGARQARSWSFSATFNYGRPMLTTVSVSVWWGMKKIMQDSASRAGMDL